MDEDSILNYPPPPCSLGDDKTMINYDVVFIQESTRILTSKTHPFYPLKSEKGILCTKLDIDSLSKCVPSQDVVDGSIEIYVGFGFRIREFKKSSQNVPSLEWLKKEGYDCIDFNNGSKKLLYLHIAAVVPVAKIRLRVRLRCEYVCMDYYDRDSCYICPSCEDTKHAICWDCLVEYLKSSTGVDSSNAFNKEDCTLVCCFCHKSIDITSLGSSEQAKSCQLKIVEINKNKFAERAAIKASDEATRRANETFQRRLQEDRRKAMIEDIRRDIIENVMTMKCPRCKCAFIEYEGCNALTCGNSHCQAGFCALCFQDCGNDAHDHIRHAHPGQMHTNNQAWVEGNKSRQREQIKVKLQGLTAEEKKIVLQDLDI